MLNLKPKKQVMKGYEMNQKEKVFKFSNVYFWELKRIDRELKEKLQTLKTKNGKIKAIKKTLELKKDIIEKSKELKENKFSQIEIKVNVEWKKSNMWGMNPHAEMWISGKDKNGKYQSEHFTSYASGCGYDKLSHAVGGCFNQSKILKSYMISKTRKLNSLSYTYGIDKYFSWGQGVGIECFRRIFKDLGCEWLHNQTKTSDFIQVKTK